MKTLLAALSVLIASWAFANDSVFEKEIEMRRSFIRSASNGIHTLSHTQQLLINAWEGPLSDLPLPDGFVDPIRRMKIADVSGHAERSIYFAVLGDIYFKTNAPNDSMAISNYKLALENALKLNSKVFQCEALKRLIYFFLTSSKNYRLAKEYINQHQLLAYDDFEHQINIFFQFRNEMVTTYFDSTHLLQTDIIPIERWKQVENACLTSGHYDLLVSFVLGEAVYYEQFLSDSERALATYDRIEPYLQYIQPQRVKDIRFIVSANTGHIHLKNGRKKTALAQLNRTLRSNFEQQKYFKQHLIYGWLSDTYALQGQYDSAYYFAKKIKTIDSLSKDAKYQSDIFEIESKYQNEQLSHQLTRQNFKRRQNGLVALILGIAAVLTGLVLVQRIRLNRIHRETHQIQLEQKEQEAHLRAINAQPNGQDKERKRIALQLHDRIGSALTSASLHIKAAQLTITKELPPLQKASSIIKSTNEEIRDLSHDLYSPVLLKFGLYEAVEELAAKFSNEQLKFEVRTYGDDSIIDDDQKSAFFSIIQELIGNVIAHSEADFAYIQLELGGGNFKAQISDNGKGFNTSKLQYTSGLGLAGVEARMANLGGRIEVMSKANAGTKVTVEAPV